MFEFLKNYSVVLVTGPQRSGTRICARMIAKDTRLTYVDELAFKTHYVNKFISIIKNGHSLVIQCPAMCHIIHKVSTENIAVVLMLREIADIRASERRINWQSEERELKKYRRKTGIISEVKYSFWLTHQRRKVHNPFEIEYRKLEGHPLWVDKDKRASFSDAQWKI